MFLQRYDLASKMPNLFEHFRAQVPSSRAVRQNSKVPSYVLRQSLDGVAEHGSGHSRMAFVEPVDEALIVALASLAQEPSDSLMDEVVGVMEQNVGNGVGFIQLIVSQELHGGDNAYALFPYRLAITGKVVEDGSVLVEQPCSQQFVTRKVYEIPVINAVGMTEVEVDAFPLIVGVLLIMLELLYKDKQSC